MHMPLSAYAIKFCRTRVLLADGLENSQYNETKASDIIPSMYCVQNPYPFRRPLTL